MTWPVLRRALMNEEAGSYQGVALGAYNLIPNIGRRHGRTV
jgi:hypothetical protein